MLIIAFFTLAILCVVFFIAKNRSATNKEKITKINIENQNTDTAKIEYLVNEVQQINGQYLHLIASVVDTSISFDLDILDYSSTKHISPDGLTNSIDNYINKIKHNIEVYQQILELSDKSENLIRKNNDFLKSNVGKYRDIEYIIEGLTIIADFKQTAFDAIAHFRKVIIANYHIFSRNIDIYISQRLKLNDLLTPENYNNIKSIIETYDTLKNDCDHAELSNACKAIYETLETAKDAINLYLFNCNLTVLVFNTKVALGVDIKNTDRASTSNYISHVLIKTSNALLEFEKYSELAHKLLLKINDIKQLDHKGRLYRWLPFIEGIDEASSDYIQGNQKNIQFFKTKAAEIRKK